MTPTKHRANLTSLMPWLLSAALLIPLPGFAADGAVTITIYRNNDVRAEGVATVINKEMLLVNLKLLNLGNRYEITDTSGARLAGTTEFISEADNLALLKLTGLSAKPATFAAAVPEPPRKVALLLPSGKTAEGSLLGSGDTLSYEIAQAPSELGAALLNNCGQVIGFSDFDLRGFPTRKPVQPSPGRAQILGAALQLLKQLAIEPQIANAACLSTAEQLVVLAKKEADLAKEKAALEAAAAKDKADTAAIKAQKAKVEKELSKVQSDRDGLAKDKSALEAAQAQLEKDKLRLAKEKAAAEAEQQRIAAEKAANEASFKQLALGGVLLVLIVALVVAFLFRKRKAALELEQNNASQALKKAEARKVELEGMAANLAAAQATWPDIVLDGTDEAGNTLRLKIIGSALIRSEQGQTIGRAAGTSDYMLGSGVISRKHLRLHINNNQLFVTDLGSENGTFVNGERLYPDSATPLNHGDQLALGPCELQVHVLSE